MTEVSEPLAEKVQELSISEPSETVFKSTEDFSVIHPLTNSWTLWYVKPPFDNKDWNELLTKVVDINSVEEFWGSYNNLPKVSELPLRSDYALFKTGIRPEWEDPQNANGGKFVYQFSSNSSNIDEVWLNILLSIIGGTMDLSNKEINGVFVNVRKAGTRFNIWTKMKNYSDNDDLKKIGSLFKSQIGNDNGNGNEKVEFSTHNEYSRGKPKLYV